MKLEDVEAVISDFKRDFTREDAVLQAKIRVSPANLIGAAELAARRGWQTGVFDVYEAIKQDHPEAAQAILKEFRMDADGNITM